MKRWLKFNAVGAMGACLQLTMIAALTRIGVHYLLATLIGVECAILHNFVWHRRWTWRDRGANPRGMLRRFHLASGFISVVCNLAIMRVLTGGMSMPPVAANMIAIVTTGLVNYLVGNRWVFANDIMRIGNG